MAMDVEGRMSYGNGYGSCVMAMDVGVRDELWQWI